MRILRKGVVAAIATAALLLLAVPAQAAMVSFTLTGDIQTAGSNNPFGVSDTDTITATGTFLNNGFLGTGIDQADLLTLTITVGTETFDNAMDVALGFGGISFFLGAFDSLDFNADPGDPGFGSTPAPADFFSSFDNFSSDNGGGSQKDIAGKWVSYSATVVPVPAAVWLFGSGLLGLIGVARRKKVSA